MIERRHLRIDFGAAGFALSLAVSLAHVAAPLVAQTPPTTVEVRAPLADVFPRLQQFSAWRQDRGAGDTAARRGVFPVGNGRAFAYLGVGERANTLHGLVGPDYLAATPERFGTFDLTLEDAAGTPIECTTLAVRRVRGAGFVVSEDRGAAFVLRTLTFAPPETSTIWRVVEVEALDPARAAGELALRLRVTDPLGAATAVGSALVLRGTAAGASSEAVPDATRCAVVQLADADSAAQTRVLAEDHSLLRSIRLGADGRWVGVVTIETRRGSPAATESTSEPTVALARELAAATLAWFEAAERPEHTVYRTDHERLASLFEDWKTTLQMLRCAETGQVVALTARERGISVRQNNGILLALLRYGMWEQAGAQLDAVFAAARRTARVEDHYGFAAENEAAGDGNFDWKNVDVVAAEVPSWIILQHYWYWRSTGDAARIDAHWPLLDVCLKRQQRSVDDLLPFVGDEPYLNGALYRLPRSAFAEQPGLIACDPRADRAPWSLASNVLFLLATQAFGELAIARQKFLDPNRADTADGDDPYRRRMFKLMQNLERNYWLDEFGHFAPALSPIDRSPHLEPVANVNLLPLWAGWTYPTGERSRDNLQNSLARLARPNYRVGTTGAVAHTTGDLQGMLLVALSERDCAHRLHVLDTVLELAAPAGSWPELFDAADRPIGDPLDVGASGVNLDAIGFALSGVRHASVPAWDRRDIRLELRLPHGAERFAILGSRKDGRVLDIEFDRETHLMSAEEIEAQAEKPPEKQRDPTVLHPQIHALVTLREGAPERGYYDVAMHAGETLFVRYLALERNSADQPDLTRIEERDYIKLDEAVFLPADGAQATVTRHAAPALSDDAGATKRTVALSSRGRAGRLFDAASTVVVDTGLPFELGVLRDTLIDADGAKRVDELVLDWNFDTGMPVSFVDPNVWRSAAWRDLQAQFVAAGGRVLATQFLQRGSPRDPNSAGGIELAGTEREVQIEFVYLGETTQRAILRVGASADLDVRLDGASLGEHVAEQSGAPSQPDTTSFALELAPGPHRLELVRKRADDADSRAKAWVRFTDARGVPLDGVRQDG